MSAPRLVALVAALALGAAASVPAAELVIQNATVHTVDARGTLQRADVRVTDGRIAEVGAGLAPGAGATIVDGTGKVLTPGLFGGVTALGVEEVSLEPTTVDHAYAPGVQVPPELPTLRPELDVLAAFNPRSVVIPVQRADGITFAAVAPSAVPGGTFVPGSGGVVTLDGRWDAELPGSRTLFVHLGDETSALSGNSRAAQWMLLERAVREAKSPPSPAPSVLSPLGREALAAHLGRGRVAFRVHRAADIRRVLAFAKRHGITPVIVGGAQAADVAGELAAARVPVLIDGFQNLPSTFDQLGVALDRAARLHAAGVDIAFTMLGDATHNARKVRQGAGVAVAHGLPWDAALAALTATPARIFGQGDARGRIAPGLAADLVLWSGDPLEVTTVAEQVWIGGVAQPVRNRQTELRDRYAPRVRGP